MSKITFTPAGLTPLTWEILLDGVPTGCLIQAPSAEAVNSVLVRLGELLKLGEGMELYTDHFRAYSLATGARRELPKEALPAATLDGLNVAAAVVREFKLEIAKPAPAQG